jgi:hypothetical protein
MDTRSGKNRSDPKPQREEKHPREWEQDLNPSHMAGQNIGPTGERESHSVTAYEMKGMHRVLAGYTDDELKQFPVLTEGTRLQQGATYIDLAEHHPTEFKVNGGVTIGREQLIVPKDRVPYPLWNKLLGEEKR